MTNKIVLKTTEEFMSDYTPVYQPIFPLFLKKSQAYSELVGKVDFKRVATVGDVRAKHITPKDTEMAQIAVADGKKSFKKYFLANQFVQSTLQDTEGIEDVVAQVLDEHNKQADELLANGDGTTTGDIVNNGLILSTDPNYKLKSSVLINSTDHLTQLHALVMSILTEANQVPGEKMILFYGDTAVSKLNGIYAANPVAFRKLLSEVAPGVDQIELPSGLVSGNGFIVVNRDMVKLHYVCFPKLDDQDINKEKKYVWHNFLMGSFMLEVLASGGIIRQPLTFS